MRRSRTCRSRACSTSCSRASSGSSGSTRRAILLLEDDDTTLIPRAAKGLEEEVERGIRIPVGTRVRRPHRRHAAAGADPERRRGGHLQPDPAREGARVAAGRAADRRGQAWSGVLHVGTLTERAFDDEDVELLQRAGDRAALAISSRLTERERGLADALQRSLMPRLPERAGRLARRAATCRRPPSALGGDWYDAFALAGRPARHGDRRRGRPRLPRRGDHGPAPQRPARIRARRAIPPSDVLERLSRLLRQLEPGRTATVVYLILDPHGGGLVGRDARATRHRSCTLPASEPACSSCRARCRSARPATRATRTIAWSWSPARCSCSTRTASWSARASRSTTSLERLVATVAEGEEELEHLGDTLVDVLLPGRAGERRRRSADGARAAAGR